MKNTIFNKVCAFCDFRGHNAIVLEMHVKSVHSQEIERNSSPNEKSKNIGSKNEKYGEISRKRRNATIKLRIAHLASIYYSRRT